MTMLAGEPALLAGLAGILGLLVGSFLNVVIHRLPRMMEADWKAQCAEFRGEPLPDEPRYDLVSPGSSCPACGHRLRWHENIPVLSWLVLRGRCSACKTPISPRYPLVELLTALLSAAVVWVWGANFAALGALVLVWFLVALAFIDFDTFLLPDSLTLPLIWLGLFFNLWGIHAALGDAVAGAMAGYLALWSVYWLFKLSTGKEGMGYGDFKLAAALGAWLGWQALPAVLIFAALVGALVGLALIAFAGHDRRVPIPFGPYLAGGGLIALFFGDALNSAYLGLI